jgi:hypothetical protein
MAIKRYYAKSDNTITNAFEENLVTRGTGANMGASDILEVFSIYGQANSSSAEKSRALIKFDVTASTNSIKADRTAGTIPASGNVNFFLRLYNAPHGQTLPKSYDMKISAITGTWSEGPGLDMELYKDKGDSNWINRFSSSAGHTAWTSQGGDYYTDTSSSFSASFTDGPEDIELDISMLMEQWLSSSSNAKSSTNMGSKEDEGIGIQLSGSYETAERSYYTKKFFGRGTEFFFKRPCIEARWNSSTQDDRGNFYYSSSLATAEENLNTIYLYNYFRGRLRNIPDIGTGKIYVSFFSGSVKDTAPTGSTLVLVTDGTYVTSVNTAAVTGGYVSTGIYSASVAITAAATPLSTLYDVWFSGGIGQAVAGATKYHTGSITPIVLTASITAPINDYAVSITNLRDAYRGDETARFRVYTRQRNWSPTIYSKASTTAQVQIAESGSYEVYRVIDELKIIPYGTGNQKHTVISYDANGSYFDLDMKMFETGYMYGIKLSFYNEDVSTWVEQPETFKFKVESRQS